MDGASPASASSNSGTSWRRRYGRRAGDGGGHAALVSRASIVVTASRHHVNVRRPGSLGLKGLRALGAIADVVNLAVAVPLGDMGGPRFATIDALGLARQR